MSPATPVWYYIYYRVAAQRTDEAAHAVRRLLQQVEARTGIAGYRLCRRDDAFMWMEVYENVGDASIFERALAQAVDASGLAPCLDAGGRTTERFVTPQRPQVPAPGSR
ncbi:MAG: DUF4936 family protein [Betaproteobacteria bacterium]